MNKLDSFIGLHELIEIIYVVDGYQAILLTDDGDTVVHEAQGDTIDEALSQLLNKLTEESE